MTDLSLLPDFNFGASFTTSKYYVGFAMTNLFRGSLIFADTSANKQDMNLVISFSQEDLKFLWHQTGSLNLQHLLKSSDMFFKSFQMDLTARIYYKDDYWAGISYRTNDAMIMLLGLKYDRFYFAYAFDFALTDIRTQSFGTHELSLAVKFGESARRYRWMNAY